jgi:hypothetical protein
VTRPASRAAVVLTVLTLVFLARVAGQALVVFFGVTWLPPPDSWYSGLLPYPLLLPTHAITRTHSIPIIVHWILAAYLHTLSGVWRDRGESVRSRTSTQRRAGVGEAGTRWGP